MCGLIFKIVTHWHQASQQWIPIIYTTVVLMMSHVIKEQNEIEKPRVNILITRSQFLKNYSSNTSKGTSTKKMMKLKHVQNVYYTVQWISTDTFCLTKKFRNDTPILFKVNHHPSHPHKVLPKLSYIRLTHKFDAQGQPPSHTTWLLHNLPHTKLVTDSLKKQWHVNFW